MRDEDGFDYPIIDQSRCDRCGECRAVCPACKKNYPTPSVMFSFFCTQSGATKQLMLDEIQVILTKYSEKTGRILRFGTGCSLLQSDAAQKSELYIELPCRGRPSPLIREQIDRLPLSQDTTPETKNQMLAHFEAEGNGLRLCCYACLAEKRFHGDLYLTEGPDNQIIIIPISEQGHIFLRGFMDFFENTQNENAGWYVSEDDFSLASVTPEEEIFGSERAYLFSDLKRLNIFDVYCEDMQRAQEKAAKCQQYERDEKCAQYRQDSRRLMGLVKDSGNALEKLREQAETIIIYGAGGVGRELNELLEDKILCYIDQEKYFDVVHELGGKPVYHLNDENLWSNMSDKGTIRIIVTPGWDFDEIKANCQEIFSQDSRLGSLKIFYQAVVEYLQEVFGKSGR